jgi:hypothetical protein
MLYMFGFQKVGVVLSDLYFVDPDPDEGQEGAERGVRLEVRLLSQGTHDGSIYAARPIGVDRPVWRADLLEQADGPPGSFDRTHHHPSFRGWEPGKRSFDPALSAEPVEWVGKALEDLPGLLAQAQLGPSDVGPDDARQLRDAVPEILATLRQLLDRVHKGELATAPLGRTDAARVSWL